MKLNASNENPIVKALRNTNAKLGYLSHLSSIQRASYNFICIFFNIHEIHETGESLILFNLNNWIDWYKIWRMENVTALYSEAWVVIKV